MTTTVLPILGAYLLGAIPFGLLVARVFGVPDIRAHGSGNIGATNVWRVLGARAGVWVYLLDIGKGIVAVAAASRLEQTYLSQELFLILCAVAVILGHVFPVYLRFKGGKGVSAALGASLVLLPIETAVGVGVFVLVVSTMKYISLGSLAGAISIPAVIVLETKFLDRAVPDIYLFLTIIIACFVILTHRQNIQRLMNGKESRFSFSSKGNSEEKGE